MMRIRKDHTRIKLVDVCKDGKHPSTGNGATYPLCTCCRRFAAPKCVEWLLHSSCPISAMRQADCSYQEEARFSAQATVETTCSEVVVGIVLCRIDYECTMAIT